MPNDKSRYILLASTWKPNHNDVNIEVLPQLGYVLHVESNMVVDPTGMFNHTWK